MTTIVATDWLGTAQSPEQGGQVGRLIQSMDWSETSLGPLDAWPQCLKTAVQIALNSHCPMMVWWGRELTTIYNDATVAILGEQHPTALGRPASEIWQAVWSELGPTAELALRKGQAGFKEQIHLSTRSGDQTPSVSSFNCSLSPISNDLGEIGGVFFVCTEIAKSSPSDAAQMLLAAIVASSDDAIISKDVHGKILSWNAGAERIFGYTAQEAVGQPITMLIPNERHDEERVILERLRAGERIDHFETIRVAKDGRNVNISLCVSPLHDQQGNFIGASKVARDITAQKRAEAELAAAKDELSQKLEARFRHMANNAPVLIWVNGVDGCEFVNREYLRFVGRQEEEIRGMGWQDCLHPDDAESYLTTYREAVSRLDPFEAQVRMRRADGEYRWLRSGGVPRLNPDGSSLGYVGCSVDITDIKRSEETLKEAKELAEAANRSKDRFLAVLSHELRTPLTPVLLAAAEMELDPRLPPSVRQDAAMIRENVRLETKLIDDLLDLSRIASGKLKLVLEHVDLNEIVLHVCRICRSQIEEKAIRLHLDFGDELKPVTGDPARLHQVLWNVLKNATKFTPEGGDIFVTTANNADGRPCVHIRDTGIGIGPDVLGRIFDAFEQGDAKIAHQFGGLGLGLAISRVLMELHGGSIRAESDGPGQGATITIEFPAMATPKSNRLPRPNADVNEPTSPLQLLIVEDHADTARLLSRLLRSAGYEVMTADSASSALDLSARHPFDIILSDLGLPDASGYELMREIRRIRPVKGIAMSGYGMDEDYRLSREAGFSEHLTKPVDLDQLQQAINRVAERDRAGGNDNSDSPHAS